MNQHNPHVLTPQIGIVGENAAREIVERPRQLDAGKPSAGNHEGQQRLAYCWIAFRGVVSKKCGCSEFYAWDDRNIALPS